MTTIYCARVFTEGEWKLVGGSRPSAEEWWQTYVFLVREDAQGAVDRWNNDRHLSAKYEVIEVVYDEDEVGL